MSTILIADDEARIRRLVSDFLKRDGHTIVEAADGKEALNILENRRPGLDMAILDVMMPGMDGFEVLRELREQEHGETHLPVMLLTARAEGADQVRGLEGGADDYVTKPFSMPVLLRKIGAILRRCRGEDRPGANLLRYRDLTLDLDAYTAMRGDLMLELTNREFECLRELLQNQGRVMTYQMLVSRIWNYDYLGDDRVIYSHIKNLRRKLGADYIRTVRGVGYRVDKD